MKLIGLTGTSGSGKGYVAELFAAEGILSIDTDAIVHSLYRENALCIEELEKTFGSLQNEQGEIDRKKLAAIVFADPEKLKLLNAIVHRFVKAEVFAICQTEEKRGTKFLLLDAPQLFEAGMESLCHRIVAVVAPREVRIERIMERDQIDRVRIEERLRNQHTDEFFEQHADYVIYNDGKHAVSEQVKSIIRELQYD